MKNDANRWIAAISLLSLFAIIACAGTRTAARQTTQNVLVTNSSSQPIPIAARPGTGAYIVSVANAPSVKVVASAAAPIATKDVNSPDGHGAIVESALPFTVGFLNQTTPMITLSSASPTVIDAVNLWSQSDNPGENVVASLLSVFDHSGQMLGYFMYLPTQGSGNISAIDTRTCIPVPANGTFEIEMFRTAATGGSSAYYNIAYHTVPNP